MRALLQRVVSAQVRVNAKTLGRVGRGLLVFLGVGREDGVSEAVDLANKVANLRVFENKQGRFDLSVLDVKGEVLVVSQFTLYADCRKGRRPSFTEAAPPQVAERLYLRFIEELRTKGLKVECGAFGEHMEVELTNDGPVTILLETKPKAGATC